MPASTLCKALTVVAIVFAVAFVIVGGIIPTVVDNVITKSVRSAVVISPNDQSVKNDKYTKWAKDENVYIDYYLFNITNKDAALNNGDKLQVKECGPYSYQKVIVKFNVTFITDAKVQYYEWIYYVPQYKAGIDPTVDKVTVVNFPWLLAVGSTAVPLVAGQGIFDQGDNDQVGTLYYGAYVRVLGTLAPIFLNSTTSPFLFAVRVNMVPNMINYLAQKMVFPTSYPAFFMQRMPCSNDTDCLNAFNNTMCGVHQVCVHQNGAGLDEHMTSFSLGAIAFLFNQTQPAPAYSFMNFSPWSSLLPVFLANTSLIADTTSWPPSLVPYFTVQDMQTFVLWVGGLVNPANTAFLTLSGKILNETGKVNVATWPLNDWSDYGVFQFATGGVVFQLTNDPAHRSLADMLPGKFPVGPEPFKMPIPNNAVDYATAKRLLTYTLDGIGNDIVYGIITPLDRRYFFYIVNGFFLPLMYSQNGGLFTTRTASEILWGYADPVGNFPGWTGGNSTSQDEAWMDAYDQPNIKYTGSDQDSRTGVWQVYYNQSSLTDIRNFPRHVPPCTPLVGLTPSQRFGYNTDCKLWNSTEVIDGSRDGTSMPPFTENNAASVMRVYVSDALRVVNFLYRGDVTYKGITLHNYTIDQNALLSANSYPPNSNYFMLQDPDLIIPTQRYYGGADLFLSLPHYMSASPTLFANLTAGFDATYLAPDYSKHQSYVLSEPISGVSMNVHKRLMVGVKLSAQRFSPFESATALYSFDYYSKLWRNGLSTIIYLPTMWVDERGEISDDDASSFKSSVYQTRNVAKGIQIGFVIFGGLALVVIALFFYRKSKCMRPPSSPSSTNMTSQPQPPALSTSKMSPLLVQ